MALQILKSTPHVEDPQIETLLKMTNYLVSKIIQQLKEAY